MISEENMKEAEEIANGLSFPAGMYGWGNAPLSFNTKKIAAALQSKDDEREKAVKEAREEAFVIFRTSQNIEDAFSKLNALIEKEKQQ